jgi:hypothetical protein
VETDILDEIFIESKNRDRKTLISNMKVPAHIKKYIKSTELFIQYEEDITDKESILNIPLMSQILPLAWLTDTNVRINSLDKRFHDSMYMLRDELNKIFHLKRFKTEIIVDNLVENRVDAQGTALLFSGGVDSTYSLLTNLNKKPSLVMVWGIDMHVYPKYANHWNELRSLYTLLADNLGFDFSMVKTNACMILDNRRVDHYYHEELCSGTVGMKLTHTLRFLPLVAPLSIGRFNECLVAASIYPSFPFSIWSIGTIPSTDEKIVWANVTTRHSGFISRLEKVKMISDHIKSHKLTLKVCLRPELNCCKCSKCYRTIISLLLYGVDPNTCGFKVTEKTFDEMRKFYEKDIFNLIEVFHFLRPMQELVNEENTSVIAGSARFLK